MHEYSPRFSAWPLFVLTVVAGVPPASPLTAADTARLYTISQSAATFQRVAAFCFDHSACKSTNAADTAASTAANPKGERTDRSDEACIPSRRQQSVKL
jgi:hypothetical protein